MKHYTTRIERDRARRHSLSYRLKFWFWSDHTKEVKTIGFGIGGMILATLWFGSIFFIPHFFR